jgi:hypothetical protein
VTVIPLGAESGGALAIPALPVVAEARPYLPGTARLERRVHEAFQSQMPLRLT